MAKVKAKPKKAEKKKERKDEGKEIGKITHFFNNIDVAVVELTGKLKVGDKIKIKGATTDFEMKVNSMQVEHEKLDEAKKGQSVGLKVKGKVRQHDKVYVIK
jgi:putative protease